MKRIDVSKFKMEHLKQENVVQLIELFTKSFNVNDPFIKQGVKTQADHRKYYEDLIPKFIKAQQQFNAQRGTQVQFNHVYKFNGKIIASSISIYLPSYFHLCNDEEEQTFKIMKKIDSPERRSEMAIYSQLAVHKDFMAFGIAQRLLDDRLSYFSSKGIQFEYVVCASQIMIGLGLKAKVDIIYEDEYKRQNVSIRQVVFRIDMEKHNYLRSKL